MYLCAMQTIQTRERILERMFHDIRKHGFQGLRADKVLSELAITKGALYHYFPNKHAIGIAVIEELIRPNYVDFYQNLAQNTQIEPINALQKHLHHLAQAATDEDVSLGCPLNNLMQEMSPLDEDFRIRMKSIANTMVQHMSTALQRGQQAGSVRTDVHPEAVAQFLWAGIEGAYSLAKVRKNAQTFRTNAQMLSEYLETLKP